MTELTITIPDAFPLLSVGNHKPGTGKACIMDAISIVTGRPWEEDHPSCVHPVLRPLFVAVNDNVGDADRHRLWEPALRAIGTAVEGQSTLDQQRLSVALHLHEARRALAGQKVADHSGVATVLGLLLAWQESPNWDTRRPLWLAQPLATPPAHCRGCLLIHRAVEVARQGVERVGLHGLLDYEGGPDELFATLDHVLDAFEQCLPRPSDAVPNDVDWDSLRARYGVAAEA